MESVRKYLDFPDEASKMTAWLQQDYLDKESFQIKPSISILGM